jgi:outer membrane protein TolC
MSRRSSLLLHYGVLALTLVTGCRTRQNVDAGDFQPSQSLITAATDIQAMADSEQLGTASLTSSPRTFAEMEQLPIWDLTLQEAIHSSLANSKVVRDLGGQLINNPAGVRTAYEPALRESDPRFGTEAALSAFDAQFTTNVFWNRLDRAVNNVFEGGGTTMLQGDTGTFQHALTKRGAAGTQVSVRNNTNYEANNVTSNTFPSAWDTNIETEFRQPLLQGAGIQFNQIAGPNATPGLFFSNGVLVARINTDVSLADFEASVRGLVSDVENAYWDLYFAYRDLDAKVAARNGALETWRAVRAKYEANSPGGEAGREAETREQYFILQAAVDDAQLGSPGRSTVSGSGSGGGVFRGAGGVLAAERRLRLLMGILAENDRLIRPVDEPVNAKVSFEWSQMLHEALSRRVELRRQRFIIRRRELELIAARNFLLPRLDAIGLYRFRGFGNDLISANRGGKSTFDNAYMNLTTGDYQEWQFGAQLQVPIGFRQGHAAVRNAQLQLARERAVLSEQELQVAHDLSSAVADCNRVYLLLNSHFHRRSAAVQQVDAAQAAQNADAGSLDAVLTARRRLAEADGNYYRNLSEYAVCIKNVHFEKGTLLDYDNVRLAEGPWASRAYDDAQRHALDRQIAMPLNYHFSRPATVNSFPFPQQILEDGVPDVKPERVAPPSPEPLSIPQGASNTDRTRAAS